MPRLYVSDMCDDVLHVMSTHHIVIIAHIVNIATMCGLKL